MLWVDLITTMTHGFRSPHKSGRVHTSVVQVFWFFELTNSSDSWNIKELVVFTNEPAKLWRLEKWWFEFFWKIEYQGSIPKTSLFTCPHSAPSCCCMCWNNFFLQFLLHLLTVQVCPITIASTTQAFRRPTALWGCLVPHLVTFVYFVQMTPSQVSTWDQLFACPNKFMGSC
jgi:hypothetical protein